MNDNNKNKSAPAAVDDVDRLFARLGSGGADGYRDFEPGRLPVREAPIAPLSEAAAPAAAPAPVEAAPAAAPILATIRPLRAEPARRVAGAAAGTPLAELFQRLLKAESPPASAGPLRRMFGR